MGYTQTIGLLPSATRKIANQIRRQCRLPQAEVGWPALLQRLQTGCCRSLSAAAWRPRWEPDLGGAAGRMTAAPSWPVTRTWLPGWRPANDSFW